MKSGLDKAVVRYAHADCINTVTAVINNAVANYLSDTAVNYDSLCSVEKDKNGKAVFVTVDSKKLNVIKSELTMLVLNGIEALSKKDFSVPFGNIFGSSLLSGRGDGIKIKIVPLGSITSETKNLFTAVGINQSRHEIYIDFRISVSVLAPFTSASVCIAQSVPLAETIILGEVPYAYITTGGDTIYDFTHSLP